MKYNADRSYIDPFIISILLSLASTFWTAVLVSGTEAIGQLAMLRQQWG